MSIGMPTENTFDHLRGWDGEHVGYIHLTAQAAFVPFDLLHRQRGEPMELHEAEALLDGIGLALLAEPWWLEDQQQGRIKVHIQEIQRDHVRVAAALETLSGPVGKAVDLLATTTLPLPTDRLHESP